MGRGAVILARHGEPALSRDVRLTGAEYRQWWGRYEEGGLKPGQPIPADLKAAAAAAGAVVSSTRLRSIESARALTGADAFTREPDFIEAPLPPPNFPRWLRLSPRTWGFLARFWWWWFNHHEEEESRRQAQGRAAAAADRLIALAEGGEDVLLVAHGFFNAMIGRALRARGWRRTMGRGWRYWSVRRFESAGGSARVDGSSPEGA
ncbi:MAG TPA: histidine phosphatase family protein [Caulobacteraceae bacterium]|nr:histidine phosphatase family protein [Caulobacteraceae bacterium]